MRISDWSSDVCSSDLLFLSMAHARETIAAWVDDYNTERPHSSLGYATPAAFAAGFEKQWHARVRAIASTAPRRDDNHRSLVVRKSVVEGKTGSERVDPGGTRIINKKK